MMNTTTKLQFLLALFCFLLSSIAQATQLRAYNQNQGTTKDKEILIEASSSLIFADFQKMVVGRMSGSATSPSNAHEAYIPLFSDGGGINQQDYTILDPGVMPFVNASDELIAYTRLQVIGSNTSSVTKEVFVAVQNESTYNVVALTSNPSNIASAQNDRLFNLTLDLALLCDESPSRCSTLLSSQSDGNRQQTFKSYFFLAEEGSYVPGDSISPGSYNGFYIDFLFSDRVPNGHLKIDRLARGDGRLVAEYSVGSTFSQMGSGLRHALLIVDYNDNGSNGCNLDTCPASNIQRPLGPALIGEDARVVKVEDEYRELAGRYGIEGLKNGQVYAISLALVNRFQFASNLSQYQIQMPLQIEQLLEASSCFIVTAGFGYHHPIVQSFQKFRDQKLRGTQRGELFIATYYRFSPAIAQVVLTHPWLQRYIQLQTYLLYYLSRYIFIFLVLALLLAVIALFSFKEVNHGRTQ